MSLTPEQFSVIASIAEERWGLHLPENKAPLVCSRITRFIMRSEYSDAQAFIDKLKGSQDAGLLLELFDVLSTNTTSFFREPHHFDYLAQHVYPHLIAGGSRKLRIWSAACSTGEEPYSLAMHAFECIPDLGNWDFQILATDLSSTALYRARNAAYTQEQVDGVPSSLLNKYFVRSQSEQGMFEIHPSIKSRVSIHPLNLADQWPMTGPFDAIFVRNVMIYFDREMRRSVAYRMGNLLSNNGALVIGSSETLNDLALPFHQASPAVYTRPAQQAAA